VLAAVIDFAVDAANAGMARIIGAAIIIIFLVALLVKNLLHENAHERASKYHAFDARHQDIVENLQLMSDLPGDRAGLEKHRRKLDLCADMVLCLATTITDRPDNRLSANYMEPFTTKDGESCLVITRAAGVYSQVRFAQERRLGSREESGTCGRAFSENKILLLPDLAKEEDVAFFGSEKSSLGSVINIPVPGDDGVKPGGVLNIDCPFTGVLSEKQRERAVRVQALMARTFALQRKVAALLAPSTVSGRVQ
jgi:hypothetical protein